MWTFYNEKKIRHVTPTWHLIQGQGSNECTYQKKIKKEVMNVHTSAIDNYCRFIIYKSLAIHF